MLGPEERLQVLHPLEVGDGDAARVGEDVGHEEDAPLAKDRVGFGRRRSVRALDDELRLDVTRVARGQLVADRCGHEKIAIDGEQLLVADLLGTGKSLERLLARPILEHPFDRKAERVVNPAVILGDRDHGAARFFEQLRADAAHVAEALHGDPRLMRRAAKVLECRGRADRHAATGGLDAAQRTADLDRLAGDRGGRGVTQVHRERVHDPGHRLTVGVHVGRRNVAVASDQDRDLGRESPRHVLELVERQLVRVDDDAALRAAERDVDHGAFPGHPHRERLDLVQRDVGVVANAALGGSAVDVVLHAVTREDACVAVVELDRKVTGELALNLAQDLAKPRLQLDQPCGLIELRLCSAPLVSFNRRLQLDGHISTDDRGYSAAGSQITLTHAGRPDLTARSSAGRIWSGLSTSSP